MIWNIIRFLAPVCNKIVNENTAFWQRSKELPWPSCFDRLLLTATSHVGQLKGGSDF